MSSRKSEGEGNNYIKTSKTLSSIQRRNERERHRIMQVNRAFDDLRKRVPSNNNHRKISKVETLRSAIEYIKALNDIVNRQNGEQMQVDNDVKEFLNFTPAQKNIMENFCQYDIQEDHLPYETTCTGAAMTPLYPSELSWQDTNESTLFGDSDIAL